MYYNSRAIILKTINIRESDKLVTLFTEKAGKVSAVARGVQKPGSSLRACVQPFCNSLLFFSSGRNLDLITQGRLINFFGNCRENIERAVYVVYIMELLEKSLLERMPLPELYKTTLEVVEYIDAYGVNPLIIRYMEMKLLVILGYKPVIKYCAACGSYEGLTAFSLSEGGMLCSHCVKGHDGLLLLKGETAALVSLLAEKNLTTVNRVKATPTALLQLEAFLENYLEYHIERKFRVKNTIKMLKEKMIV